MKNSDIKLQELVANDSGVEYEEDSYFLEEDSYYQIDAGGPRQYSDIRKEIILNKDQYAINYVIEMIESKYLDLSPEFQRNEVWNDEVKKSLFIESLLLNIPIPIFYVYANEDGQLSIIDGKQRLSTIRDFVDNKFVLKGVKYLSAYNGLSYQQLPERVKLDFKRYQCYFYILNYNTPKRYLFDIFMRINTGSMPLTSQEIRNIFAKPKVRDLMKRMAKNPLFLKVTQGKVKDNRMEAQELALRFIALRKKYDFKNGQLIFDENSLSRLLEWTIGALNDESDYQEYEKAYEDACRNALELLDGYAFTRVYKTANGEIKKRPNAVINKALFTVTTVLLSEEKYNSLDLKQYRRAFLGEFSYYLDHSGANLIAGTSNKTNIVKLFSYMRDVLKESIKC